MSIKQICKELGISDASYYLWRNKNYKPSKKTEEKVMKKIAKMMRGNEDQEYEFGGTYVPKPYVPNPSEKENIGESSSILSRLSSLEEQVKNLTSSIGL